MAISSNIQQLEKVKFVESSTVPGQAVVAIANPDGSEISSGLEYNATLPTLTDGQMDRLQGDDRAMLITTLGRLIAGEDQTNKVLGVAQKLTDTSDYAYSIDKSTALEGSSVIKNEPGNLYKLQGYIDASEATGDYFLQVINATSVPGDGAVSLLDSFMISHTTGTKTGFDYDLGTGSIHGDTGLVWCLSSTEFTKTVRGSVVSATAYFA
jgi:hypothetical protein